MSTQEVRHEPVTWQDDGGQYNTPYSTPYSERFADVYRTRSGGLRQARDVFMAGCGLPAAWRGHERYTVLETGFGLGLNFLATWDAWRQDPERSAQLHFVSVEAYPVSAADMLRSARYAAPDAVAGAVLPTTLADELASELAAHWPSLQPGLQTWALDGGRVHLTLAIGHVHAMLPALARHGVRAHAVYLDGFSPKLNPEMWSTPTFAALPALCLPGARLASYTVSRMVRDGLAEQGFAVRKCPNAPPKRWRLEAQWGAAKVAAT